MKMTLARALKEKKRLAGKIAEMEMNIRSNNVFYKENEEYKVLMTPKVDILDDWNKCLNAHNKMAYLKNAIARANSENGITRIVYEMEEKKSVLAFIKRIDVNIKAEKEYAGDNKIVFFEKEAQLSKEYLDNLKNQLQAEIDACQDKIDELNAVVVIDYDLEIV